MQIKAMMRFILFNVNNGYYQKSTTVNAPGNIPKGNKISGELCLLTWLLQLHSQNPRHRISTDAHLANCIKKRWNVYRMNFNLYAIKKEKHAFLCNTMNAIGTIILDKQSSLPKANTCFPWFVVTKMQSSNNTIYMSTMNILRFDYCNNFCFYSWRTVNFFDLLLTKFSICYYKILIKIRKERGGRMRALARGTAQYEVSLHSYLRKYSTICSPCIIKMCI